MNFSVSVVIPVYKAGHFIEKAVHSAVQLPEVLEVLLIEDASPDDSYSKCLSIQSKFPGKVKVFTHPGHVNKGAAESRNVGIENAIGNYISFLDADDFYLSNRFEKTKLIFEEKTDADGVYEAIGTHPYDQISYENHIKRINDCNIVGLDPELTTLTKELNPEELFPALVFGNYGWFHFNGLTLKKGSLSKSGLIRGDLNRFGEDNEFFLRLAVRLKLYPGELKSPVAKRGVYEENVTLNTVRNEYFHRMTAIGNVEVHKFILKVILEGNYSKSLNRFALMRYLDNYSVRFLKLRPGVYRKLVKLLHMLFTLVNYPRLIKKIV